MTSRRKPEVAVLFTFAAALLIIAAAGFSARFDASPWFLGGGVLLASFASYVNARVVLGRVVWRNHLARLAIGLLIYLLGVWAVHLAR